jgi:hypothetical protein
MMDFATRIGPRWAFELWASLGRSGFDWERDGPRRLGPPKIQPIGTLPVRFTLCVCDVSHREGIAYAVLLRTLAGGGWYMLLMLLPLAFLKPRRHPLYQALVVLLLSYICYCYRATAAGMCETLLANARYAYD